VLAAMTVSPLAGLSGYLCITKFSYITLLLVTSFTLGYFAFMFVGKSKSLHVSHELQTLHR